MTSFLFLTFMTLQVQAQVYEEWTQNGWYTIGVPGEDLFMTINASGDLEWAAKLPGDDEKQVWAIVDHVSPASTGYMQITATIAGEGNYTMGTIPANISGKNTTLTVRLGDPISDNTAENYGYDQFQRRKSATNNGGNDALFIKTPSEGGSRYGVAPSAAGDPVQFDGGGIDKLEFKFVSALSTNEFDSASIIVTNPVNNQLIINGLPTTVKQISVYSLLGSEILTKKVEGQVSFSTDVSTLPSGVYVVEIIGISGKHTVKVIKQ